MASGFVAPWQSIIWLALLCMHKMRLKTNAILDAKIISLHNIWVNMNFQTLCSNFQLVYQTWLLFEIWHKKKTYLTHTLSENAGVVLRSVNLLNSQPWTIFLFYPSLNFMILLWSSHQTSSKTFLWHLIYCNGQHCHVIHSECFDCLGTCRRMKDRSQIFIMNNIYKTLFCLDSSLSFLCCTVLMSTRTNEYPWKIAANSAAVFSSVT